MAAYDYRCDADGVFEITAPMGTAPSTSPCPVCGEEAPRSFTPPLTASLRKIDSPMGPLTPDKRAPDSHGPPPGMGRPPLSHLPMTAPMRGMPRP